MERSRKETLATSKALLGFWQRKRQILEGKKALGIKLSNEEKKDLHFYRAFLTVSKDRILSERGNAEIGVIAVTALVSAMLWCSGCAAPLLLGIKEYKSGDTHIKFITGADFTVGANGTDTVSNHRGIEPEQVLPQRRDQL